MFHSCKSWHYSLTGWTLVDRPICTHALRVIPVQKVYLHSKEVTAKKNTLVLISWGTSFFRGLRVLVCDAGILQSRCKSFALGILSPKKYTSHDAIGDFSACTSILCWMKKHKLPFAARGVRHNDSFCKAI